MKKVFLIFLLLVLPLQTLAAAERAFAHALGNGGDGAHGFAWKHFVEHSNHVPHHHGHDDQDDDDDHPTIHEDNSSGSIKHILDVDQSSSFHAVVPAIVALPAFHIIAVRPECQMHALIDCPRRSLFRPPRASA